jgi:hypothetical protein
MMPLDENSHILLEIKDRALRGMASTDEVRFAKSQLLSTNDEIFLLACCAFAAPGNPERDNVSMLLAEYLKKVREIKSDGAVYQLSEALMLLHDSLPLDSNSFRHLQLIMATANDLARINFTFFLSQRAQSGCLDANTLLKQFCEDTNEYVRLNANIGMSH